MKGRGTLPERAPTAIWGPFKRGKRALYWRRAKRRKTSLMSEGCIEGKMEGGAVFRTAPAAAATREGAMGGRIAAVCALCGIFMHQELSREISCNKELIQIHVVYNYRALHGLNY